MRKCSRNVKWKDSVAGFLNNGLANCLRLHNSLCDGSYQIDPYTHFTIHEPKTRNIVSTRFKDRVFQGSLSDNYLYEQITKSFIRDNCACQVGKGTDDAMMRLSVHMREHFRKYGGEGFVLQCDLSNFFGSTTHETAKTTNARYVPDEWAYSKTVEIIDSFNDEENPGVGMGLGSEITQITQLAVLNPLDHYIKERLGIRHYVRYNDDFILIHNDIEHLKYCRNEIKEHLEKLELKLSEKKTKIFPLSQGINFLGFKFRITETGKIIKTLNRENIAKRKRKIRKQKGLVGKGIMTKEECNESYQSWKAHAKRGNTHNLILEMDKFYKEIWRASNV